MGSFLVFDCTKIEYRFKSSEGRWESFADSVSKPTGSRLQFIASAAADGLSKLPLDEILSPAFACRLEKLDPRLLSINVTLDPRLQSKGTTHSFADDS